MIQTTANGPHVAIHIDAAARPVPARRTDGPLGSASTVADMAAYARAALRGVARGERAVLVDLRRAPLVDESKYVFDDEAKALVFLAR